ncbi:LHFPL tetraspan subfamily member 2a protein [Neodiprion pinetum]|uniref:LHFPL tetraspan subfamily member 2a protein n=1 Tax=Neodiprion pinetum TaxID=441929 RepID=UPI001EE127C6|nr:LHFPL tetraspan subfamily member 2a protein [Neodiprion pinetum]XP_046475811.1 LHFPL tetraspan subfamily member 2a protein [Neodiprion pinetum]
MCYVIVTGRSLFWTLMSLSAVLAMFSALMTPRWLAGPPTSEDIENATALHGKPNWEDFNFDGLATLSSTSPDCWKAAFFFLALGLAVMTATVVAALIGCCVQSVGKKSIFDLAGVAQSIAGIMYLLGMILYVAGWGSSKIQGLCGDEAVPFYLGNCSLGWASYLAVLGVLLTFASAVFSSQAEKSTASDKVQDQINEGKTLICLA